MRIVEQIRTGNLPSPESLLEELTRTFPLIDSLAETPQDAQWHAEGDVRVHTLMVVEEVFRLLNKAEVEFSSDETVGLVIGAALHDIAKPLTTREHEIKGKIRIISPRHAERGQSYVAPLIGACDLNKRERAIALGIIRHHHDPKKMVFNSKPERKYSRLARVIAPRLLYYFEQCDIRGRICDDSEAQLETLELFKLELENFGLWHSPTPYHNWDEMFVESVPDADQRNYVYREAVRLFELGLIFHPEEAIGKTWEHRQEFGQVTMLCAPSGSGKSSWVDANSERALIVSLDEIREELTGKRSDQSKNGQVLQLAKERLREGLRNKRNIIWDATALRRDSRSMVTSLAHDYHALSRLITFGVDPDTVMKRNRKRRHAIPNSVIEKQYRSWQWPDLWEAHEVDYIFQGDKNS